MSVALAAISGEDLDVGAHVAAVQGPSHGALATFVGTVRDHSRDAAGQVVLLEYVAHPSAEEVIRKLSEEVSRANPEVALAASHRIGSVAVGGAAIVVCAASAHRGEAFDACRQLVERIKAELPMWKKQVLADGSHTWVGSA